MAMSRETTSIAQESENTIVSAFKRCTALETENILQMSKSFYVKFVDSLYSNGHIASGNAIKEILLEQASASPSSPAVVDSPPSEITLEGILEDEANVATDRLLEYRANDQKISRNDFFYGEVCEAIYLAGAQPGHFEQMFLRSIYSRFHPPSPPPTHTLSPCSLVLEFPVFLVAFSPVFTMLPMDSP